MTRPSFYDPNGICPRVVAAVAGESSVPPANPLTLPFTDETAAALETSSEEGVQELLEGLKMTFSTPGTCFESFRSDFLAFLLQRYGPKAALEKAKSVMEYAIPFPSLAKRRNGGF